MVGYSSRARICGGPLAPMGEWCVIQEQSGIDRRSLASNIDSLKRLHKTSFAFVDTIPSKNVRRIGEGQESEMDFKATLRDHVNPAGFCVAATYVLLVALVFGLTAATTKPSNVGYDWIPFFLLAMPWSGMNARLLLPGLTVNVILLYLLGTLLQVLWYRVIKK